MSVTALEEIIGDKTEIEIAAKVPAKRKKREWEPITPKSSRYEEKMLGLPVEEGTLCFGCKWLGNRDEASIEFKQIKDLNEIIRTSIGKTDLVTLVQFVAEYYEKIRLEINDNLIDNERALPPWPAVQVMEHIKYHNTDPELQKWLRSIEMQEIMRIAREGMVEYDSDTGCERINPQQNKVYLDTMRGYNTNNKMDASKQAFYSNQSFKTKTDNQAIDFSSKSITDYMNTREK